MSPENYTDTNDSSEYVSWHPNELSTTAKFLDNFKSPAEIATFIFSIIGSLANISLIVVIVKTPQNRYQKCRPHFSTHSKLIISLAVSDTLILVALLLEDLLYIFSSLDQCQRLFARLLLDMALLSTLMNLLAMALDHYLAIVLPFVHNHLMTNFHTQCFIVGLWQMSLFGCLLEFLIGYILMEGDTRDFCSMVSYDKFNLEIFIVGFIFVALSGIVYLYITIYIRISQSQFSEARHFHRGLHKSKAFITTVLLIGTFIVFWTPHGVFQVYVFFLDQKNISQNLQKIEKVNQILFLILQLNSLVDPLIYAIRLPSIRAGYKAFCSKGGRKKSESYSSGSNNRTESMIPLTSI